MFQDRLGQQAERRRTGQVRKTTIVTAPGAVFQSAKDFFARKTEGQYMMIRIDDKSSIGTIFRSYEAFVNYKSWLERKYGERRTAELFSHMYIIEAEPGQSPELQVARRREGRR